MRLIYLHGLDSDHNALKAKMVDDFCQTHYPQITVIRPNLNLPPDDVVTLLKTLIGDGRNTVLMGSSLGGYFANLMSDKVGVPCVLLNPSIRPDLSFQRFLIDEFGDQILPDEAVIYTTTGGWDIKYGDLAWFTKNRLRVLHSNGVKVLLKMGDELLDAKASLQFYKDKGAAVIAQDGGDHRMSDFAKNVAMAVGLAVEMGKQH
ncbi:hypothetical protein LU293_05480 [Moraxella nasovis]|uniref:YqiA/YcfP family alpha/beta fold hydrolase n=1 Tax=Moraxella nasovis TaxID=2904121 RepID=UPI001F61675F|nr:YqiA/YcfP family alpha/beta fold hydrolase [Moraxella nasovis]UNU72573.1 hypothetical protein LU293_05480 [Moraxella nasovis]